MSSLFHNTLAANPLFGGTTTNTVSSFTPVNPLMAGITGMPGVGILSGAGLTQGNNGTAISYDPTDITTANLSAMGGNAVGSTNAAGYLTSTGITKTDLVKWAVVVLIVLWMYHEVA